MVLHCTSAITHDRFGYTHACLFSEGGILLRACKFVVRRLLRSWQCKEEGRAMVKLTGKLDARTELASELGSNVETKASAASFASAVVFAAPEAFEDVCLVTLANANASVAHSDDNAIALLARTEVDLSFFSIFEGIREEILDKLAYI